MIKDKVIEFPKNRQYENKLKNAKLDVAIKLLESFTEKGIDFHIIIDEKSASEMLEDYSSNELLEYFMITTNFEKSKHININGANTETYVLKGNEFG